jgi:ADP-ribose pyrophosphatase YjhB (NUDIX family)
MRETINPGENLDIAVKRGLIEEFGAEAEIVDYIGSIRSHFKDKDVEIEKTTIYFVCKLISQDLSKRSDEDIEGKSYVEWQTASFLIPKMKEQSKKYSRTDIDESEILERFQKLK